MNKKYTPITPAQAFAALAVSCPTKERYRFHNTEDGLGQEGHLTGASGVGPYPFFDSNRNSWALCARVTFESPIAKGHNPRSLTEEQVGVSEGWRLLTKEECYERPHVAGDGVEFAWNRENQWHPDFGQIGVQSLWTFRTKHPEGHYLPKPKIAEGFNPHSLTVEQVGEGFRLLTADEIRALHDSADRTVTDADYWYPRGAGIDPWMRNDAFCVPSLGDSTVFRTQKPAGYFLPKVPQYVPWTFETAPKGHVLIRAQPGFACMVYSWGPDGISYPSMSRTWADLLENKIEHSLDGGKTWSLAATEVKQ